MFKFSYLFIYLKRMMVSLPVAADGMTVGQVKCEFMLNRKTNGRITRGSHDQSAVRWPFTFSEEMISSNIDLSNFD